MLIVAVAFASKYKKYDHDINMEGMVDRLGGDAVFALGDSAGQDLVSRQPDLYYLDEWKGVFPGFKVTCVCADDQKRLEQYAEYKYTTCPQGSTYNTEMGSQSNEEIKDNCFEVFETGSMDLSKFYASQKIHVVRGKKTSFLDTYTRMNQDGTCQDDFILCPGSNQFGGICLDKSFGRCPLTDIANTSRSGYNQTQLTGFSLWTSNEAVGDPIAEVTIAESHHCFMRREKSVTPGRFKYPHLKGSPDPCIKDMTSISLNSIGELDLFSINGLDFISNSGYTTKNDYQYYLLAGRRLPWHPNCNYLIERVQDTPQMARVYNMSISATFVMLIVAICNIGMISVVKTLMALCSTNMNMWRPVFNTVRIISWIAIVIPTIFTLIFSKQIRRVYLQIDKDGCVPEVHAGMIKEWMDGWYYQWSYHPSVIISSLVLTALSLEILAMMICAVLFDSD